jgi:lipoprotein-anchoring transpeptidase ErfK/SrfK
VWSTLTLKGTANNRTPTGIHRILWRVPNETMTSERIYPPIPRDAPGGYYLRNVLFTQYFTSDGASIHYNYWSSNWGYPGSHGCLGVAYNEAKFAWDWGEVGTPVYVFA